MLDQSIQLTEETLAKRILDWKAVQNMLPLFKRKADAINDALFRTCKHCLESLMWHAYAS